MGAHDDNWRELSDEALERLLVERWLSRGLMLVVIFAAAIAATWVGTREVTGPADYIIVGVLVALALGGGATAFVMRQKDLAIHDELRRRRQRQ